MNLEGEALWFCDGFMEDFNTTEPDRLNKTRDLDLSHFTQQIKIIWMQITGSIGNTIKS